MTLPGMHQSNMIVNDDWNITGLIEFEFALAQPEQMVGIPTWLSGQTIDGLIGPELDEYKVLYDEFVAMVEEEEAAKVPGPPDRAFSRCLREDWHTGRMWYNAGLRSSNGFPIVFEQNIRPLFYPSDFDLERDGVALMKLWDADVDAFVAAKIQDKDSYDQRVREIFAEARRAVAQEPPLDGSTESHGSSADQLPTMDGGIVDDKDDAAEGGK